MKRTDTGGAWSGLALAAVLIAGAGGCRRDQPKAPTPPPPNQKLDEAPGPDNTKTTLPPQPGVPPQPPSPIKPDPPPGNKPADSPTKGP